MSTDLVRWGMIGCGDVAEVKSGPGFQKARGSRLVAVMRRDAGRAEDYARRHGVPRWYRDAAQLIADPEVDAVYVATPPSTHRQYTLMAAAAGKPVYVEKPMAHSIEEARVMARVAKETGLVTQMGNNGHAGEGLRETREWIQAGCPSTWKGGR